MECWDALLPLTPRATWKCVSAMGHDHSDKAKPPPHRPSPAPCQRAELKDCLDNVHHKSPAENEPRPAIRSTRHSSKAKRESKPSKAESDANAQQCRTASELKAGNHQSASQVSERHLEVNFVLWS